MLKINKHQNGSVSMIELIAIVVVVGASAFVVNRIISVNSEVDQVAANTVEGSDNSIVDTIKVHNKEEDKVEEVEVPKKEEIVEEVKEEVVAQEVKKEEQTTTKPDKKQITYLQFKKGGSGQEGSKVKGSATLESAQTGTCHIKFYREGEPKVYGTHSLKNEKTCSKTFDASKFSVSGEWDLYIWFVSSDGKTEAYQDEYPVSIDNKP